MALIVVLILVTAGCSCIVRKGGASQMCEHLAPICTPRFLFFGLYVGSRRSLPCLLQTENRRHTPRDRGKRPPLSIKKKASMAFARSDPVRRAALALLTETARGVYFLQGCYFESKDGVRSSVGGFTTKCRTGQCARRRVTSLHFTSLHQKNTRFVIFTKNNQSNVFPSPLNPSNIHQSYTRSDHPFFSRLLRRM